MDDKILTHLQTFIESTSFIHPKNKKLINKTERITYFT